MDSSQVEVKQHQTNSTQWTDGVMLLSWSTREVQPNHTGCQLWCNNIESVDVDVCAHVSVLIVVSVLFVHALQYSKRVSLNWLDKVQSRRHMLAVSSGQLCNNNSTSISLIHTCDNTQTIFCLHHPPTGPFIYPVFFKVVTPGHGKCFLLPPNVELWWTNCEARVVYRMKQNKKQRWKMGAAVSFRKAINVACGGQKRSWPKPISRFPQLVYVCDVVGFSLCHERTYSNVYGY